MVVIEDNLRIIQDRNTSYPLGCGEIHHLNVKPLNKVLMKDFSYLIEVANDNKNDK
jgi:hypothetical protein